MMDLKQEMKEPILNRRWSRQCLNRRTFRL